MTLLLASAWDFARIGTATMTVDDDGTAQPVTFTSGVYSHIALSTVVSTISLWSSSLKAALDAASNGAGTYTVALNETTRKYTISYSNGNFDLTFTGAAGTVMQNIIGFSGNKTGAASYTSDNAVYYLIGGSIGAKADVAEYEPDEIVDVAEADDGTSYGIARSTAPIYYDCLVPFEAEASVRTAKAAATAPWTWQRFYAHTRAHEVFALKDSLVPETTVHRNRAEGAAFKPEPSAADPNFTAYYNMRLRTYLLGRV